MTRQKQPEVAQKRTAFRRALLVNKIAISLTFTAFYTPSFAQDSSMPFISPRFTPPEAALILLRGQGQTDAYGWRLVYRNGLRGADVPDIETETRIVLMGQKDNLPADGVISWRIIRTRNDTCVVVTGLACPDRLEILSLPEGYIAIPESVWVEEGEGAQILIVPGGLV